MKVFRLCSFRYPMFDGIGAKQFPGRWNKEGTAMVYTASSLSLATLEMLVHSKAKTFSTNLVSIMADIPDELIKIYDQQLPVNWNAMKPILQTAIIGSEWAQSKDQPILRVPTVISAGEYNYLINPLHQDFDQIKIDKPKSFRLDARF